MTLIRGEKMLFWSVWDEFSINSGLKWWKIVEKHSCHRVLCKAVKFGRKIDVFMSGKKMVVSSVRLVLSLFRHIF